MVGPVTQIPRTPPLRRSAGKTPTASKRCCETFTSSLCSLGKVGAAPFSWFGSLLGKLWSYRPFRPASPSQIASKLQKDMAKVIALTDPSTILSQFQKDPFGVLCSFLILLNTDTERAEDRLIRVVLDFKENPEKYSRLNSLDFLIEDFILPEEVLEAKGRLTEYNYEEDGQAWNDQMAYAEGQRLVHPIHNLCMKNFVYGYRDLFADIFLPRRPRKLGAKPKMTIGKFLQRLIQHRDIGLLAGIKTGIFWFSFVNGVVIPNLLLQDESVIRPHMRTILQLSKPIFESPEKLAYIVGRLLLVYMPDLQKPS